MTRTSGAGISGNKIRRRQSQSVRAAEQSTRGWPAVQPDRWALTSSRVLKGLRAGAGVAGLSLQEEENSVPWESARLPGLRKGLGHRTS